MKNYYLITYSPDSLEDLRQIYSYIAYRLNSPQTGRNLVKRIRTKIRSLNTMPERHALLEDQLWDGKTLRKFPIGNYVILYEVKEENREVIIFRVFGGRQDIEGASSK